jgi:PEGA domain
VRPYKRFIMFCAAAALVTAGTATTSEAQVRGHVVVGVGGGYYRPYYYRPYYYSPFLFDPWYGYQYPYPPYPYGYTAYEPDASVRLEVKPKQAEVYVDGYYAGIVDDFDGTFQRLRVSPGEHELELWLDGYHTVRQKVHLSQDNTFRIKYQMEKLAAGQAPEPKPQPIAPPPNEGNQPRMQPRAGQPMGRGPMNRPTPPPPPDYPREPESPRGPEPPRGRQANGSNGTLAIRVQPGDAEISIDGEPWRGPSGQERLTVEVPEGSHTVEIRKSGFRTYVTQVDVHRGQTTPLNVSLRGDQ